MELLEAQEEKLITSLMTTFIAQMDSALRISKIISEHSEEDELSVDSIILGLVYRLMVPMKNNEIKESMDFATELVNGTSSDEDEDEDEDEEGSPTQEDITFNRKVKTNNCNCDICSKARVCLINYDTFEITDPLAEKFKNAIQKTCDNHKIFI